MDRYKLKVIPKWTKTKDEIWKESFESLTDDDMCHSRNVVFLKRWLRYASIAAAVFLVFFSSLAFLYTQEIVVGRGEKMALVLPDGSDVLLNAESVLRFKPYWWYVNRGVELVGEGFFEVAKGKKFRVNSENGVVSVLGTSFNVFSRKSDYRVACVTGKVGVETAKYKTVLLPNQECVMESDALLVKENKNVVRNISWVDGMFYFENAPFTQVIAEIERQYDVSIKVPAHADYFYTGNFSKSLSVEEVLEIVGTPFAIVLEIAK